MQFDLFSTVIITILAGGFLYAFFWIWRVKKNGIEADAVVTERVEHESTDADGITSISYTFRVRYQTQEGWPVEATLANPKSKLQVGNRVKIRYLPNRTDYPVLIQILD